MGRGNGGEMLDVSTVMAMKVDKKCQTISIVLYPVDTKEWRLEIRRPRTGETNL